MGKTDGPPPMLAKAAHSRLTSTFHVGGGDFRSLRMFFQSLFGPVSNARWEITHSLIRKSGHFIGYGVIGLASLRAWWMTLPHSRFLQDALLALMGTALLGGADEYHQTSLPNRTGSPWDVLLDCCGAIVLQLATYVFMSHSCPRNWRESSTAHCATCSLAELPLLRPWIPSGTII
jgi:VanZ family protein